MEEQLRQIGEQMRRIDRKRLLLIERAVRRLGILPSQHFVLMQLSRAGKVTSQAQIAEMLHVSPARMTLVLKNLVAEGYIERACGADVRCNEISITQKGQEMVCKSCALFSRLDTQCYAGLTDADLHSFSDYLDRISENLTRMEREEE